MENMDTIPPGMPSTMIPATWDILVVELKDCFFTIPSYPNDTPKFAFMPSINNTAPVEHYQRKVLAQGTNKEPHNLSIVRCSGIIISQQTISRGVLLSLHGQYLKSNINEKRPFTDSAKPDASIKNIGAASSTRKDTAATTWEIPSTQNYGLDYTAPANSILNKNSKFKGCTKTFRYHTLAQILSRVDHPTINTLISSPKG